MPSACSKCFPKAFVPVFEADTAPDQPLPLEVEVCGAASIDPSPVPVQPESENNGVLEGSSPDSDVLSAMLNRIPLAILPPPPQTIGKNKRVKDKVVLPTRSSARLASKPKTSLHATFGMISRVTISSRLPVLSFIHLQKIRIYH